MDATQLNAYSTTAQIIQMNRWAQGSCAFRLEIRWSGANIYIASFSRRNRAL